MTTAVAFMLAAACAGALMPLPPARAAVVSVVEFYQFNFGTGNFHLATSPSEIASLDTITTPMRWLRTFFEFKADDAPGPGLVPVCRFVGAGSAQSRPPHFFTAFPEECAALKADAGWVFEGIAFYARLPDNHGDCGAGTMPIYRSYNGARFGGPAHRFTPYRDQACTEFGEGCVREGLGGGFRGVAFCVPQSRASAQPFTRSMSSGAWEFSYAVDGTQKTVRLAFGDTYADYPSAEFATQWPYMPYHAHTSGDVGIAGWDPVAGKMVVVHYGHAMFQFDFDGVMAGSGCAFPDPSQLTDLEQVIFGGLGRGPCHPLTIRNPLTLQDR